MVNMLVVVARLLQRVQGGDRKREEVFIFKIGFFIICLPR